MCGVASAYSVSDQLTRVTGDARVSTSFTGRGGLTSFNPTPSPTWTSPTPAPGTRVDPVSPGEAGSTSGTYHDATTSPAIPGVTITTVDVANDIAVHTATTVTAVVTVTATVTVTASAGNVLEQLEVTRYVGQQFGV